MAVSNFDWNVFETNGNWVKELKECESRIEETCREIIKTLGGYNKIKKLRGTCCGSTKAFGRFELDGFIEENVTLLKRSGMLCFRRCDKHNGYIISKSLIKDINGILFKKVFEDDFHQYYTILFDEAGELYWKYDIVI